MSMPYAREYGLAASAGRLDTATAATAAGLALIIALAALSLLDAIGAALLACAGAVIMKTIANRQIGGQTGDVLGGTEQICETAILLFLAARLA